MPHSALSEATLQHSVFLLWPRPLDRFDFRLDFNFSGIHVEACSDRRRKDMSTAPATGPAVEQSSQSSRSKPGQANPRRPRPGTYTPKPETVALLKISGNSINGLGEMSPRQASPFFWHPPDQRL